MAQVQEFDYGGLHEYHDGPAAHGFSRLPSILVAKTRWLIEGGVVRAIIMMPGLPLPSARVLSLPQFGTRAKPRPSR